MTDRPPRRLPWLRILVEGVVIVVSVLLALAGDAWLDQRQQRKEELAILQGLQADLEATLDVIHAQRTEKEHIVAVATRLISLGGSEPGQVSAGALDTLLAELLPGSDFQPVDATLRALINSEGLEVISDPQLRAMLAEWSPLVAAIRRDEDQNQNQFLNQFLPYLYDRVSVRTLDALGTPGMAEPPSGFSIDARPLLAELRFENHVNDILFYQRSKLRSLEELEEHVREVLTAVEAELHP